MQGLVDLCYVKATGRELNPATCKSQVQRPTAEQPRNTCNVISFITQCTRFIHVESLLYLTRIVYSSCRTSWITLLSWKKNNNGLHGSTHPEVINERYDENRCLRAGQLASRLRQRWVYNTSASNIAKHQRARNALARVVTRRFYEEDGTHLIGATKTALACNQFPHRLQDRNAYLQGSEDELSGLSQTITPLLHTLPTSAFHQPTTID